MRHAVGRYREVSKDPQRIWISCTCGWDTTGSSPKTVVRRRERHIRKANKWEERHRVLQES